MAFSCCTKIDLLCPPTQGLVTGVLNLGPAGIGGQSLLGGLSGARGGCLSLASPTNANSNNQKCLQTLSDVPWAGGGGREGGEGC